MGFVKDVVMGCGILRVSTIRDVLRGISTGTYFFAMEIASSLRSSQ